MTLKNIFISLLVPAIIIGCTKRIYIPVETTKYVAVHDTTTLRDTTIKYEIEKQYVRDYTGLLDELVLETDYAIAKAHVDTTNNVLAGSIENKQKTINMNAKLEYRTVYRDSIIYEQVPYPVVEEKIVKVVPLFWRIMSVVGILAVAAVFFYLWHKFF